MIVKTSLGAAAVRKLRADACLTLGRRISNIECGLAHAARAIQDADAKGLVQGLQVASRFAKEVETLIPSRAKQAREIKNAAEKIDQELRAKKKVSSAESAKVLEKIRVLAVKTNELHQAAQKHCGGGK